MRHYVEMWKKGSDSPTHVEELENRFIRPEEIASDVYAWRFFDTEGDDMKHRNVSAMNYFGKGRSLEEVKDLFPEREDIIRELEEDSEKRAVETIFGDLFILQRGDMAIFLMTH